MPQLVTSVSVIRNFQEENGRGMRLGLGERRHPKVNIFLATPDTPDYEALYRGIERAKAAESIHERRAANTIQSP